MSQLSDKAFTPEQVRELDRRAIEDHGIPGYELMCRAGQTAFESGLARFTQARHWLIMCGAGNNAGDGYVIARLARAAGCEVTVVAVTDPLRLKGDARKAFEDFRADGGVTQAYDPVNCPAGDLLVDALLGTGLQRDLDDLFLQAVDQANQSAKQVLAVDVPTGINAATGRVMGGAIKADMTVTFVGQKQGLYLAEGPEYCGEILFDDIGVPAELATDLKPAFNFFTKDDFAALLPARPRHAHKGMFGHVLVAGGNTGMGGAVRLAGEAALRTGAGLVSIATRAANVAAITGARPELMVHAIENAQDLQPLVDSASVVALGPGLGQDDWAQHCFEKLVACDLPKVIDADALNLLADSGMRRNDWVLTPHPGEAGRLLGVKAQEVQKDRLGAVLELQSRYGGAVVLKGHGTLVAGEQAVPFLVREGNPGMASAGMGDVLTGVTAGLLAQCRGLQNPAAAGVYAHALAGDQAAVSGERGLIAGELLQHLRSCLNP